MGPGTRVPCDENHVSDTVLPTEMRVKALELGQPVRLGFSAGHQVRMLVCRHSKPTQTMSGRFGDGLVSCISSHRRPLRA